MSFKKFLKMSGKETGQSPLETIRQPVKRKVFLMGQASLEYFILLAVIGVLTLVIGSYFLDQTRQSSQDLFSTAVSNILR